ncbi:MAG: hypothetical protein ACON5A_00405 [Candidatus Comchoanobacterales bacterium]
MRLLIFFLVTLSTYASAIDCSKPKSDYQEKLCHAHELAYQAKTSSQTPSKSAITSEKQKPYSFAIKPSTQPEQVYRQLTKKENQSDKTLISGSVDKAPPTTHYSSHKTTSNKTVITQKNTSPPLKQQPNTTGRIRIY